MPKQVFNSNDPNALGKLDELWRQFRNSVVMDGRAYEVVYDKADGLSKLDITFGLTDLERKRDAEVTARHERKKADREKAKKDAGKPADEQQPAAEPEASAKDAAGGSDSKAG